METYSKENDIYNKTYQFLNNVSDKLNNDDINNDLLRSQKNDRLAMTPLTKDFPEIHKRR